jgi:hypothetical protein
LYNFLAPNVEKMLFHNLRSKITSLSRARRPRTALGTKEEFLYNSIAPYLSATMLKTANAVSNKATTTARQKARNARKARFRSFIR